MFKIKLSHRPISYAVAPPVPEDCNRIILIRHISGLGDCLPVEDGFALWWAYGGGGELVGFHFLIGVTKSIIILS